MWFLISYHVYSVNNLVCVLIRDQSGWKNITQCMAATRCKTTLSSSSAEDNMALHCRFVCEGTVEERIIKLQEQKLQLAQNVLSG